MRRQWILIGQSFLKKFRTIEDKFIPSRVGEKRTRPRGKGPENHGRFWAFKLLIEIKNEDEKQKKKIVHEAVKLQYRSCTVSVFVSSYFRTPPKTVGSLLVKTLLKACFSPVTKVFITIACVSSYNVSFYFWI